MTDGSASHAAPTVVVVGGGFSGLLTAIHLLDNDRQVIVRLLEKSETFGGGRAYGSANGQHLLNVRASNMSAFPDRPDHFLDWLQARDGTGDGFVRRGVYGEYLQALLRGALGEGGHPGRLLLERDEAVALDLNGTRPSVRLALGRSLTADAVVLATGLGLPAAAPGAACEGIGAPAYFADPWSLDPATAPAGDILLIGSGLTMVDVASQLDRPDRRFTVVSRHGLLPRSHGPAAVAPLPDGPLTTPRETLRSLRAHAAVVGWRSAVDSLRPLTPAIWRGWSLAERRRFLRHGRAWWDVHRHRMAPRIAERMQRLADEGRLSVLAARLESLEPAAEGLVARLRRRGLRSAETRTFAAAVNCTGLSADILGAPLLRDLAGQGRLRPDPLKLGIDVDDAFRVRDTDGAPVAGLYAVGPLVRGARWESVAVPDLRKQTAEIAATLLADLRAERQARRPVTPC
ncbi:MAG: FAD/NAD(P)-binding protein [Caulobacterales bacterium]|nr:FAD/NAD(P)-binding protein [Caulobacterales bacterium]